MTQAVITRSAKAIILDLILFGFVFLFLGDLLVILRAFSYLFLTY